jgi:hypothetical protein
MKKALILVICVFLTVNLCACSYNYIDKLIKNEAEITMMSDYQDNLLDRNVFIKDTDIINNPCDMVCDDEGLYIVNQGNNNILKYNFEGTLLDSFGSTGQGKGEFTNPEAITISNNKIYVVEKESCRIQIFNKSFEFLNEIKFEKKKLGTYTNAMDIEVDNDGLIYLSVSGFSKNTTKLYILNENGTVNKIGKGLIGVLSKDSNGDVYYMQSFELIEGGYQSGKSFIARINNNKELLLINRLPDQYTPTSFYITKDKLYTYSYSNYEIDSFDLNGNYLYPLYHEVYSDDEGESNNLNMTHMTFYNDIFYFSDSDDNLIYTFLFKENE